METKPNKILFLVVDALLLSKIKWLFINSNRRKVIYTIFFIFGSIGSTITAQSHSISGTVKDASTGETLIGATLYDIESGKGGVSNGYGFFSITLSEGEHTIIVSYLGYKDIKKQLNLVANQKLTIDLDPEQEGLDEVVIKVDGGSKSQTKSVISGAINLKPIDVKKLPALLGEPDITRAMLTQPGISSVGEGASGFNVRGGNIDQNLILLDEAPIYNSSHLFGFFSVFNSDAIKDMKLYKGGIPARYGGRASSVLDIRQREGNTKQFKAEGGIGLLFSRLTLEGPIVKDKVNYLISGRRSYFDLAFPLFKDTKGTKAHFYDLNAKVSWRINDKNTLFASGYFGGDVLKLLDNLGEENAEEEEEEEEPGEESFGLTWRNSTATLRWNNIFSDRLFMNISGIYSRYDYTLFSKEEGASSSSSFDWESSVENFILKPDFTYYQNADTEIKFGINATVYRFTPAKVAGGDTDSGRNEIDFGTEKGVEIAPYVSYERQWGAFSMDAGLRYSWFGNLGTYEVSFYDPTQPKSVSTVTTVKTFKTNQFIKEYTGFEPRLALKYDFSDRKVVKLGYNRMFQYIHLISNTNAALPVDIWKPSGAHIKPLEVNQWSVGYAYDTESSSYNFSAEAYYKMFNNLLEYKDGADLLLNEKLETELLPAKGYSYGMELSAHKTKGKLTGNVNYTHTVTKRKTISVFDNENINGGSYYPSNYDRPHIFNITANYKLSEKWTVGSFFTFQSGRPTTNANGKFDINGDTFFSYATRNADRLKPAHRLDLSFTYTPKKKQQKRWCGSWVFGVYNVYSNKNAFSTYSTIKNNTFKTFEFSVLGVPIPFVTYNFKF